MRPTTLFFRPSLSFWSSPAAGGGDGGKPPGTPRSLESSHRHAQMRAKNALRLTCSANGQGATKIMCPKGFDPVLWSAVGICMGALEDTQQTSSDPVSFVVASATGPVSKRLKAVNACIDLLMQLGLSAPEVAQVLRGFPDIVNIVQGNDCKRFTLATSILGGEPLIAAITTTVIVRIATVLIDANQPAACCKLLEACGPKPKHLKALLLSVGAAPLAHWPEGKDLPIKTLAEVRNDLLHEAPIVLRGLAGNRALPSWIQAVLSPQMPEDLHAKQARDAAQVLLRTWMLVLRNSPDKSASERLSKLVGKDMSRLLDLARVLADKSLDEIFKQRLVDALTEVAHATLGAEWGHAPVDPFDLLTEIPTADAGDSPRGLRPLVQCVLIGVVLGRATELSMWIPMLDDVEKHNWSEPALELLALLDEIVPGLWQAKEQFSELDVAFVVKTLRRFGTKVREGLGTPSSPGEIFGWRSVAVLERRGGCANAAHQFRQLVKRLSRATHGGLLDRKDLIETALDQVLRGNALDPVEEVRKEAQQAILDALLNSEVCREFLRWMADEAGYEVVRAVMVSLLGPTLKLAPAELCHLLMAQTVRDRFALAVALCPLVSMLQPGRRVDDLVELLLQQWSHRADAPTLLFEACVGPNHDASSQYEVLAACDTSRMYRWLMRALALPQVLSASPDDLQQCIDQFIEAREGGEFSGCFPMFVVADCALRCASRNAGLLRDAARRLSKRVGFRGSSEGKLVFNALHGQWADPWHCAMFSSLTYQPDRIRKLWALEDLIDTFDAEQLGDKRLQAAIFELELCPLPMKRLAEMTVTERIDFSTWLLEIGLDLHFTRACSLLLSQLIDARASAATVGFVLEAIARESGRRQILGSMSDTLVKFRSAMNDAKGAEGRKKKENTRTMVPLPEPSHAHLRMDLKPLTEIDDETELGKAIGDLIEAGLFENELRILLDIGIKHGLRAGIAGPNRLRALLSKPALFHDRPRPSAGLLAWLGTQCCTWQTSGPQFVYILYQVFSEWNPDQWGMVDAEQLAAFMSGVLQSTLNYLDETPNKHIAKIHGDVATLIRLFGMLMDKCLGERVDDSEHVQHCLNLLENLKGRLGVLN